MKGLKLPGFTAGASIDGASRLSYAAGHAALLARGGEVLPQLPRRGGGSSPSCESQCLLAGGSFLSCWLSCDPYFPPQWVFA